MTLSRKTRQEMHDKQIQSNTLSLCYLAAVLTLNGRFGFGEKRIQKFVTEFDQTIKDYRERYGKVAHEALEKHVKEKGIEAEWK
jgi:hypothetical protein